MLVDLKNENAKHLPVPQYEGLGTADILDWCGDHPIVLEYLPDEREIRKIPKQWLINLVYSLVGNDFKAWVRQQIDARNEKHVVSHNLMVALDPEIQKCFKNSTAISSKYIMDLFHISQFLIIHLVSHVAQKGISANLCKIGTKRRRTHQEVLDDKAEMERKEAEIAQKLARFHEMEAKVMQLESQLGNNQQAANILSDMVNQGKAIVDDAGRVSLASE